MQRLMAIRAGRGGAGIDGHRTEGRVWHQAGGHQAVLVGRSRGSQVCMMAHEQGPAPHPTEADLLSKSRRGAGTCDNTGRMWRRIKSWFTRAPRVDPALGEGAQTISPAMIGMQAPRPDLADTEPTWIDEDANPFGVRLLDVRPITLGTLSVSQNPVCAQNAVSYGGEDGQSFHAQPVNVSRRVEATLRYRAPRYLVDGALFIPREMEDKWALFVFANTLILVRSWLRLVFIRAPVRIDGEYVVIGPIEGAVANEAESEAYTVAALDFILRTHALDIPWPAPLRASGLPERALALECMSIFGRQAHFACAAPPRAEIPASPLRTVSRLHFAAMRNAALEVRAALDAGVPIQAQDRFGFAAIHYVKEEGPLLDLLLTSGAALDDEASDGATLLMLAAQSRDSPFVRALLQRGAKADHADQRGFSALHRAAEMGEVAIAEALIGAGADPDREAEGGHTPRGLAALRGEQAVLDLFPPRAS